ncbi:unnamed protein product, partial [Didymodactylos carnosus]
FGLKLINNYLYMMADQLSKSAMITTYELSYANRGLKGNTAADVQELCNDIRKCQKLVALRLEGNTINVEAAKAIGIELEKHPEIERLIWNDLFTSRLKTEVPPALIALTRGLQTNGSHIVEINLSDNAFGPIGVKALEKFLCSSCCYTLKELRLNNNGLGSMGGKMLAEALINCHQNAVQSRSQTFSLNTFICGRNRLENDGAIELAKAFTIIGTLETICMPQNGIQPPGIMALAESFVHNPNLRVIDLNDNTITKAAPKLASSIEKLTKLKILNLGSALIRTKGAVVIARSIVSQRHLESLILNYNDIHVDGALEIVRSVKNMSTLKILDLNGNCFGEDGIEEIKNALSKKNLLQSFSDDEGSEDDENEEDFDENDDEDDYEDEEENDEEVHVPRQQQSVRSDKISFQSVPIQTNQNQTDNISELIENFGLSACVPTKVIHKNNEESAKRAVDLFLDLWNDDNLTSDDFALIAKNVLKVLFTSPTSSSVERNFTENLLLSLGLVKDEQTRRRRSVKNLNKVYKYLTDISQDLPKSTRNILSVFIGNAKMFQRILRPCIRLILISHRPSPTTCFQQECFVSKYYSKKKILVPGRLIVSPGNEHLEVDLFDDENKQALGRMSLLDANKLAKYRQLILVLFNESSDPPSVRLMNGKSLANLRLETRAEKKEQLQVKIQEKIIKLRTKIDEHDLAIKLSQAKDAYNKGLQLRIVVECGYEIPEKETEKLAEREEEQRQLLEKLKPHLEEFGKVHTNCKTSRLMIFIVPSKFSSDKKKQKQTDETTPSTIIEDGGIETVVEEQHKKDTDKK